MSAGRAAPRCTEADCAHDWCDNPSWFRAEYEAAKARNALIPPHARMVVTDPVLSAHSRERPRTLTDFLLWQIDKQEEFLRAHLPGGINGTNSALAACEAQRLIVRAHGSHIGQDGEPYWSYEVRVLAEAHSDHPDYDERWRP